MVWWWVDWASGESAVYRGWSPERCAYGKPGSTAPFCERGECMATRVSCT